MNAEAAIFAKKVFFLGATFIMIFIEHLQNFQEGQITIRIAQQFPGRAYPPRTVNNRLVGWLTHNYAASTFNKFPWYDCSINSSPNRF